MPITSTLPPASTPNTHIHTPYSFSAFDSIKQAVEQAKREQVRILGISDFNTLEGFEEFDSTCRSEGIFPLYNIEFISLLAEDKKENRRWNDPKNPGIMYFCGKALNYPSTLSVDSKKLLSSLWKGTQDHIWLVIQKVNDWFTHTGVDVRLNYNQIRSAYARNTVRERHVAKAVYYGVEQRFPDQAQRLTCYRTIFGDSSFSGAIGDSPRMQNEIRNRLLKAGKPAFVEEKSDAFLSLEQVVHLILDAGGIPCYPVLADTSAPFTEYEKDPVQLAERLKASNIHAVEFIPSRNEISTLRRYVECFHQRGFCVTFGTEHNTPESQSLIPTAHGSVGFDEFLNTVSYRGACILAAHQYRHKLRSAGFVDVKGQLLVKDNDVEEFVRIGDKAIREHLGKA